MNIFPLISSPVSDLGTELPLAREVRWDFTEDKPIWHGGNPGDGDGLGGCVGVGLEHAQHVALSA